MKIQAEMQQRESRAIPAPEANAELASSMLVMQHLMIMRRFCALFCVAHFTFKLVLCGITYMNFNSSHRE